MLWIIQVFKRMCEMKNRIYIHKKITIWNRMKSNYFRLIISSLLLYINIYYLTKTYIPPKLFNMTVLKVYTK